jgi:hypothetical protein
MMALVRVHANKLDSLQMLIHLHVHLAIIHVINVQVHWQIIVLNAAITNF